MRPAAVADQHGVALGVVAGAVGLRQHLDQPAVAVVALAGGDSLGHDRASGVLPDVDHLGAGVGLLLLVDDRHRIELADRVVALKDHARILPGDGRSGFDLRPRDLGVDARALAALGDEVVDAALALGVAGVPVLHRRVLDRRVVERDQLDDRGVELVLVALGRGASLEVAHRGALVGDDQGALELAGVLGVDAEVGRELHRAADALRDVHEGAVAEDRGVERGEEVVAGRHHRAQVLPHQLGMLAHRLGEGAEDDPHLAQRLLVRGAHRHRIEDGVHGHAGQDLLFGERDAELGVGLEQLRDRPRPGSPAGPWSWAPSSRWNPGSRSAGI